MITARERNIGKAERCANPNGCMSSENRCDLFRYVRWLLYITAIRPIPFEEFLPTRFHRYSVLLNLILDIFLDLMLLHMLVLFLCTIYFNYDNGNLEFLTSMGIQALLYFWVTFVKFIFRRVYPDLTNGILDYVNEEYIAHSAVGAAFLLQASIDAILCNFSITTYYICSQSCIKIPHRLTDMYRINPSRRFTYITMKVCSEKVNNGIKILVVCCNSAIVFQFFLPLIYRSRTLPLVCWYPVDFKTPFVYEIAYFFQTVAQVQLAALFMVSCAYFLSLCYLLSGQFDILYCSLKNLHLYGCKQKELRDKVRMPNEEINEYYVTDELPFDLDCLPHVLNPAATARPRNFREAFNYALRPCVEHHIFILDVLHKVDRLFNFMWLVKTFEVTLFFCMAAFNIANLSEGKTFLKLFCIGHYLLLGLSELFMICYASEIIYIGSQRCGEALLRSPWHLHLREIRADYLLFLTSAQKTFEFTAGKLYPLRLEKFRGIITTSFSFFTLLRSMDKG